MSIPRLKEVEIGHCPTSMSVSEYESSRRSIEFTNAMKRVFNNVLDIIDKPESSEDYKDDYKDDYDMEYGD